MDPYWVQRPEASVTATIWHMHKDLDLDVYAPYPIYSVPKHYKGAVEMDCLIVGDKSVGKSTLLKTLKFLGISEAYEKEMVQLVPGLPNDAIRVDYCRVNIMVSGTVVSLKMYLCECEGNILFVELLTFFFESHQASRRACRKIFSPV